MRPDEAATPDGFLLELRGEDETEAKRALPRTIYAHFRKTGEWAEKWRWSYVDRTWTLDHPSPYHRKRAKFLDVELSP